MAVRALATVNVPGVDLFVPLKKGTLVPVLVYLRVMSHFQRHKGPRVQEKRGIILGHTCVVLVEVS